MDCASLRYRSARLNVVGVEPKGSKCNLKNLECLYVKASEPLLCFCVECEAIWLIKTHERETDVDPEGEQFWHPDPVAVTAPKWSFMDLLCQLDRGAILLMTAGDGWSSGPDITKSLGILTDLAEASMGQFLAWVTSEFY